MTDASHPKSSKSADPRRTLVMLTERDLHDATRLLERLTALSSGEFEDSGPSGTKESKEHLRHLARDKLLERRRRVDVFGPDMFGEPGWDMLLLLYLQEGGERMTQARLGELSGASRSTGLRWIEFLEREQLISREPHPTDRRHIFVSLTASARQRLTMYLSETAG